MNQSQASFEGLVMTKPLNKSTCESRQRPRSGMTMIELLVAISILVIISAILVPQLRFASADRNVREASRMVASMFAQASQRAINDGVAGVVIERNPNIIDPDTGVAYAGTSMFLLRKVPAYIGELESDEAEYRQTSPVAFDSVPDYQPFNPDDGLGLPFDVWIPVPLEQDDLGIIRVGDHISFNNQPFRFEIELVDVEPDVVAGNNTEKLRLRLKSDPNSVAGNIPVRITNDGGNSRATIGSFIIHRQPRKLVSSRIDLPAGYLVDLRLSGEILTIANAEISFCCVDHRTTGTEAVPNSITYLFNGRGSLDRLVYGDPAVLGNIVTRRSALPTEALYLMVREYSTDEGGESLASVLSSERQMWVTVEPVTGAANVISGVPVDINNIGLEQALQEARKLGSQGQAAQ